MDKAKKQYKKSTSPGTVKTRVLTLTRISVEEQDRISGLLSAVPGVSQVEIDPPAGRIKVVYDSSRASLLDMKKRLWESGYFARIASRT